MNNSRGIRSLSLDLDEKLNVFLGMNGAGKSTVLDAVAVMLSWVVSRIRYAGSSGRHIPEKDITNKESSSRIELVCVHGETKIQWRLVKNRMGHGTGGEKTDLTALSEFTKGLQRQIADSNEKTDLPLFVYYPVNRAVLDIPLRIREKHQFNLLTAFAGALTSAANFRTFFEWFREREDLENENRQLIGRLFKEKSEDVDVIRYPDPQINAVRDALSRFMPEFENLTVRRSPLRMEVTKNGLRLTVDQLSDGEKCLIALIGDLARRMAMANPVRNNPLNGNGIVLIDEIDLHLHPRWQRMIVPKLREVFPNCQFLITTHSPHVITHVEPESLFMLHETEKGITAERPIESYGKNVDRVLEDLMGLETTRPDEVNLKLRKIFEIIDAGELKEAGILIKNLKEHIGEDPELVKARVLIRRKEIIGR